MEQTDEEMDGIETETRAIKTLVQTAEDNICRWESGRSVVRNKRRL
jgi:hypothetical protein